MNTASYSFRIGPMECLALSDGTGEAAPASAMFARPPQRLLRRALQQHHADPECIPYGWNCLLVAIEGHRILIEAGSGPDAGPTLGMLVPNLLAAGISAADIDVVILSHGHGDHVGGTLDRAGKRVFPNAQHVMLKDEWDFWMGDPDLHELSIPVSKRLSMSRGAKNSFVALRDHVQLVQGTQEILPGLRVIPAPGHTPGSLAVRVSSPQGQLLVVADAVYHPIHMEHPSWSSIYDYDPKQATATRRRLLDEAAKTGSLVLAYHMNFPGLGHVIAKGTAWQWQPLG